jgi:hypothetical protein
MSLILLDIEPRGLLELCNISPLTNSSTTRLSATLAVSSECLSSLPIITLLLKRRAVYTCCQRPFNTATPVLNCTVFLGNQDLVSKATRADIIYANTLHAWRRITMTKILRDRMELRIETHQVRQEHDSSVLFRVKQQFASWYSQPEARPPVGPHKWHELHLQEFSTSSLRIQPLPALIPF